MRVSPYFSFKDRTNRLRYWQTSIAIAGLIFVAALVAAAAVEVPLLGVLVALPFLGLLIAAFVAALANGVRRLHDRGKSAWWLLLFHGVPILLSIPAELVRIGGGPNAEGASAFVSLLGLPFSIWGFVVMGCLKGTPGPNRFGEDPLASAKVVLD